jgi:hypothetical protein
MESRVSICKTRPAGVQDSTHLNNEGAKLIAGLFIEGIKDLKLPLVKFVK